MTRLSVIALLVLICGCSDTTAPPSALLYRLDLWKGPAWMITGPATSVSRGDTVAVQIELTDSTTVGGTPVVVRGICARNITISRGGTQAATLPSPVTCPDSVYERTIGIAFSGNWESRFFTWVIPSNLQPGVYTFRGDLLVQPSLVVSKTLQIN